MARQVETPRAMARVEDGLKVLRVGGIIQSVAVDQGYMRDVWDALLPRQRPASALILGLGGGSVAQLMTRRWGPLPITGVERDPEIVRLARSEFGLDQLAHVTIVTADAFAWMRQLSWTFGAICVDLYVAGAMAHGVVGGPFLRDVRRALAPGGEATFNLWRSARLEDQTRRIAAYFRIAALESVEENVIVRVTHPQER